AFCSAMITSITASVWRVYHSHKTLASQTLRFVRLWRGQVQRAHPPCRDADASPGDAPVILQKRYAVRTGRQAKRPVEAGSRGCQRAIGWACQLHHISVCRAPVREARVTLEVTCGWLGFPGHVRNARPVGKAR